MIGMDEYIRVKVMFESPTEIPTDDIKAQLVVSTASNVVYVKISTNWLNNICSLLLYLRYEMISMESIPSTLVS